MSLAQNHRVDWHTQSEDLYRTDRSQDVNDDDDEIGYRESNSAIVRVCIITEIKPAINNDNQFPLT